MNKEQQQQFAYYWYAARQAITEEDYARAFALLTFCESINPDDAETLASLGVLYEGTNQPARAAEYYRRAFEIDPAHHYYRYTKVLYANNEAQQALKALQRADKVNPTDEELLDLLFRAHMVLNRWRQAVRVQERLDVLKGFDAYSAYNYMRAYAAGGKRNKAVAVIDRYLETEPTDIRFMIYRSDMMRTDKAHANKLYAYYDRILALDPSNTYVLNNYAYLLAVNGGDLNKAEQMSLRTIREESNNAMYLDTYGWILHLKGQDQLALFYLNKARENSKEEQVTAVIEEHINKCTQGPRTKDQGPKNNDE